MGRKLKCRVQNKDDRRKKVQVGGRYLVCPAAVVISGGTLLLARQQPTKKVLSPSREKTIQKLERNSFI